MAFISTVASAVVGNVVGGIFGGDSKSGGGGAPGGAGSPSAVADPFAGERGNYADKLRTLMLQGPQTNSNGFSGQPVTPFGTPSGSMGMGTNQDPSYAFRLKTGEDAVQRMMAARGMSGSGNEMAAINDYAQGTASTEYGAQFARNENQYQNNYARLAQLSGANTGQPGQAGQLLQQQQGGAAAFNQQIGGAIVNGFGKAASGISDWWSGNQGNLSPVDTSATTTNPSDWGAYNTPLL